MSDKPPSSSSSSAAAAGGGGGGDVVELNVGGVIYTTSRRTLVSQQDSLFAKWFGPGDSEEKPPVRDGQGRYFIDRDGALFRYIDEDTDDDIPGRSSTPNVRFSITDHMTTDCSATSSTTCAVASSSFQSRSASEADFATRRSITVSAAC